LLLGRFTRAANSADRPLVLEDRIALGPRKSLVVVRCHGQRFLVATAGDAIGPLVEIKKPKPARNVRKDRKS
jgi:flagellar biogenesis protein FliO